MISVSIAINGQAIYTRTAVNKGTDGEGGHGSQHTKHVYICDEGTRIEHTPSDGAVVLAEKMLATITEVPGESL